jgi:hypothetical protein
MRKLLFLIGVFMVASYFGAFEILAQAADSTGAVLDSAAAAAPAAAEAVAETTDAAVAATEDVGAFQVLKEKFIEG